MLVEAASKGDIIASVAIFSKERLNALVIILRGLFTERDTVPKKVKPYVRSQVIIDRTMTS